jgi:hypothetical protein
LFATKNLPWGGIWGLRRSGEGLGGVGVAEFEGGSLFGWLCGSGFIRLPG